MPSRRKRTSICSTRGSEPFTSVFDRLTPRNSGTPLKPADCTVCKTCSERNDLQPSSRRFTMRWQRIIAAAILVSVVGVTDAGAQQTIVFFRHGEKPASGLGQLTCQGLNRALALPDVLNAKFGTPDFLYAPNPAVKIADPAGSFFYVRPLATIEPTAIRFGLSVNTNYRSE